MRSSSSTDLLLDLADPGCTDPSRVGAKAALLAAARAAGLPVLPGVVVPVDIGTRACAEAVASLRQGGSGAARLAAMRTPVPVALVAAVTAAARRLGSPVVVRSSSTLEGDTRWAGTFSSFADLGPEDLETAVRGVWASAFSVHALERFEAAGADPGHAHLAVLVQPQVAPQVSGSARLLSSGVVDLVATAGLSGELMAGRERGWPATVTHDGSVNGEQARDRFGDEALRTAARLVRDADRQRPGAVVEWAVVDGRGVVLQITATAPARQRPALVSAPFAAELGHPAALRVARTVARYPGALGEALVLGWGLGAALPEPAPGATPDDPRAALREAGELADRLRAQAWQLAPQQAAAAAAAALRELRGPAPGAALARLSALRPVDRDAAARVLALLEATATAAQDRGLVPHRAWLWRLSPGAAERMFEGVTTPRQALIGLGADRWEPFLHAVVMAAGAHVEGEPAVAGTAAGRLHVVLDPRAPGRLSGREVVVAERPLPALAPLLWSASALVTLRGGTGAHLIEVARSLGVPSVVAADLRGVARSLGELAAGPPRLLAVDGASGTVAFVAA